MKNRALAAASCLALVGACQDLPREGREGEGGAVEVNIAALNLVGVGDVVWDVEVQNGAGASVWQRRLTSSGYGDGAGSASYVGPCDADPAVAQNKVRVWVVGVFEASVSAANAGSFNPTHDGAVGAAMAFQNPTTPAAPLEVTVPCQEGTDTPVAFDVALMRPAQQGFFDVSVNFNDIFCSAKYDCCEDDGAGGCDPIALLFDDTGARGTTHVLGFACTAGAATNVTTQLYLDALALDCTSPTAGNAFAPPDVVLNPAAGPGNACTAGDLASCPAVLTGAASVDTWLYQFASFRGLEALTSGGVTAQKVYWNVALGVNPAISACRLRAYGTADNAADPLDLVHLGTIAAGAVYPYVLWDVSLGASCTSHALTFGDAGAPVRAAYTSTGDSARTFAYGYGPGLPAGSFCQPACDALSSCISGVCVPPPPRVTACTGLPANAVWNTATQITQSWNGSAWLPTEVGAYNAIASSTECRFTCAATHPTWTGSACTNTRVEACTGLPANAVWNTASQITQTWNGTAWLPTTAGVYSATASSTECRFACEAGATWNGTACTASGLVFHASLDNTTADLVNGIVPSVTLGAGQSFTTAHARYATASRSFAFNVNTASYLDYGHRTEFDLGAGQDFTIDTWVYVTSMGGRHRVMSQGTHIDANWVLGITGWPNAYRRTYFAFQDASQTAQVTLQATTDLVANTWYHFAVSRQGGTVRLFVNGNLQASSAVGAQNHSFTKLAATSLNVGQRQNYDNGVSYGALSLNHARLHKGVALFTSNFDVNAMAY